MLALVAERSPDQVRGPMKEIPTNAGSLSHDATRDTPSLHAPEGALVIEYRPYGLRRADGLDLLHEIIASNYNQVVDVHRTMAENRIVFMAADEVERLAYIYSGQRIYRSSDPPLIFGQFRTDGNDERSYDSDPH